MSGTDSINAAISPLADVDRVLHEPARLMIVALLYVVKSADFLFLLRQTGLTRGNLSSHLSRLEQEGYVAVEKSFVDKIPRTVLHLTEQGRAAWRAYRQDMLQVLGALPE
jgi:DNA-binding MarR family transcriptional regulator